MAMEGQPGDTNPLLIFPEEVWKLIMDKMKDSKDVLNMLEAYPVLKGVMTRSRHIYLFDLVIPHLRPHLRERALLNCRGVCQQWRNGVDHMVEHQPSLRAYSHEAQEVGQIWSPKGYFKFRNRKRSDDPSLPLFGRLFWLRYSFQSIGRIDNFLQDFGDFPPHRNPFIGRSIILNRHPWGDFKYLTSFWENVHELLRTFGKHVWFIEIWEFSKQGSNHFTESVRQALTRLPHLKSLHLEGGNLSWTVKPGEAGIPELIWPTRPHLESLKFGDVHPDLADALIRRYSPQIRRLVWSTRAWNWKPEFGSLFPNMTEFILVVPAMDFRRANKLLLTLEAPQLYRLIVGFKGAVHRTFEQEELMAWWGRFPRLSVDHFRIFYEL